MPVCVQRTRNVSDEFLFLVDFIAFSLLFDFSCRTDGTEETSEGSLDGRISVIRGSGAVNRQRKDADQLTKSERRRHHPSMPVVDVEPAVLRSFQSPSNGGLPSKSGLTYSHRPSTPSVDEKQVDSTTLSPGFGSVSNELIRVGPTISTPAASPVSISSLTKRPDSAPVLKGVLSSRPRIIIRLTSVDGLELNLTSPRQENLLQPPDDDPTGPVRPVRCGAARPQHQQAVPLIPRKSRQFHPQFVLFLFWGKKERQWRKLSFQSDATLFLARWVNVLSRDGRENFSFGVAVTGGKKCGRKSYSTTIR